MTDELVAPLYYKRRQIHEFQTLSWNKPHWSRKFN